MEIAEVCTVPMLYFQACTGENYWTTMDSFRIQALFCESDGDVVHGPIGLFCRFMALYIFIYKPLFWNLGYGHGTAEQEPLTWLICAGFAYR